jgi:Tol biopolymer transport system component
MSADDRLESWKAISAYLKRDVTTVQRWEKREGMPVHRHVHDKLGSVYAYRSELDAWMSGRKAAATEPPPVEPPATQPAPRRRVMWAAAAALVILLSVAWVVWWPASRSQSTPIDSLERAQFQMLTDFEGAEQAAAVSRDGRLVAFTSDRDGPVDVWVTQVGTGQFHNLTRGRVQQLVNPSVRTLGFSPDGAFVTFWARGVEGAAGDAISIWAIPTLGGQPKPYLEGAAEYEWSHDGTRVAYHTPGPGDPMFVGDSAQPAQGGPIFAAAAGLHAHFPSWSRDGAHIYFVQGSVPDQMDIWRMTPEGKGAEQITRHNTVVSHPVLIDDNTLMYLANVGDGNGPRLHAMDLRDRVPHVLGTGLDRYTSLAVSADGRRLVATRANPKGTLWRLPLADAAAAPAAMNRLSLPTGRGFAPRLGNGYLLYASQKGSGEAIWKLTDQAAVELWSAADARIIGGPELSADAQRIAFSVEQRGKSALYVMNADGTDRRIITDALQLRGAPAWAPDGKSIVSGATMNGAAHLVRIPLDGGPVSVTQDFAIDPVYSPRGDFIAYSAADIGTEFPVKATSADGRPHPLPALQLTRGARRLHFLDGGRALLMMRGDIRHKDLWIVDLATGKERQLTHLPADFNIRDFDVSTDGREILLERVQDHSDIVLIDLERR